MKLLSSASLLTPLLLAACATAVTQDLPDQQVTEGGSAGSASGGAPVVTQGGNSNSTAGTGTGKAGSPATNAFGGSASTAGSAGKSSGGAAWHANGNLLEYVRYAVVRRKRSEL